jgi:hypothetical protein
VANTAVSGLLFSFGAFYGISRLCHKRALLCIDSGQPPFYPQKFVEKTAVSSREPAHCQLEQKKTQFHKQQNQDDIQHFAHSFHLALNSLLPL